MAERHGYTNSHLPEPSPANHFPPGYPFIISLIIRLFGEGIDIVKKANGFFFFATLILLFLTIKDLTKNIHIAFVSSLIVMLNAHLLLYSSIEMSEVPFAFFTILSIWCFIKTFNKGKALSQPFFWMLIISIICSFYIRSIGIALLGASLLILIINKRWVQALVLALCFIMAYTPWYIRSEQLGGNTYSKQIMMVNPYRPELGNISLSDLPKRFIENANRYLGLEINSAYKGVTINDYTSPLTWKDYCLSITFLLLTFIGIFSLEKFKWYILSIIVSSFFILMLWPTVWMGVRFILPFIPMLLFLTIQGFFNVSKTIIQRVSKKKINWPVVPLAFLLLIPLFIPAISLLNEHAKSEYDGGYGDYLKLASWCKDSLPENAIICTRKPELFYLNAHRKVSGYPFITNSNDFFDFLKKEHITHVVIDRLGFSSNNLYLIPAIDNNLEKVKRIKSLNDSWIVQVYTDDTFGYVGERDSLGRKEGKGISHYCDSAVYEGEFHEGKRNGFGKYTYPKNGYYIGEFKNDLREGKGTIYLNSGGYITGEWKDDALNGTGTQYNRNGKALKTGIWVGNKLKK